MVKGIKTAQWGKGILLHIVLRNWVSPCRSMKGGPRLKFGSEYDST